MNPVKYPDGQQGSQAREVTKASCGGGGRRPYLRAEYFPAVHASFPDFCSDGGRRRADRVYDFATGRPRARRTGHRGRAPAQRLAAHARRPPDSARRPAPEPRGSARRAAGGRHQQRLRPQHHPAARRRHRLYPRPANRARRLGRPGLRGPQPDALRLGRRIEPDSLLPDQKR